MVKANKFLTFLIEMPEELVWVYDFLQEKMNLWFASNYFKLICPSQEGKSGKKYEISSVRRRLRSGRFQIQHGTPA